MVIYVYKQLAKLWHEAYSILHLQLHLLLNLSAISKATFLLIQEKRFIIFRGWKTMNQPSLIPQRVNDGFVQNPMRSRVVGIKHLGSLSYLTV